MEVKVYAQDGTEAGRSVTLTEAVFGVEPNDHAIWLDVRRVQASARQGTHKAKEKSEAAGSTRKLYRQKGTGMARAGSAKSPIRRSGGTIFGPRPRKYSLKINKKTQRLARRSALTYKAQDEKVRVVEDFTYDKASASALAGLLKGMELTGRKVLLLTAEHSPLVYQSGRNLRGVSVRNATDATTLDVLNADIVLLQEGALEALAGILGAQPTAA